MINVSIHAPVWGATIPRLITVPAWGFNPRARVGRDFQIRVCDGRPRVSIHAPVWGATNSASHPVVA